MLIWWCKWWCKCQQNANGVKELEIEKPTTSVVGQTNKEQTETVSTVSEQ